MDDFDPEELERLAAEAANRGFHLFTEWDLPAQRALLREQKNRYAHTDYGKAVVQWADTVATELRKILPGAPLGQLGETLMAAAAIVNSLVFHEASGVDLVNVMAVAGDDLLAQAEETLAPQPETEDAAQAPANEDHGIALVSDAYRRWADKPPLLLRVDRTHAYMLLCGLQLLTRLPVVADPLKQVFVGIGREIQEKVADTPELYALMETGWNPAHDVPHNPRKDD